MRGDLGGIEEHAHDVVGEGCAGKTGLGTAGFGGSLCRAARGQDERKSGGGAVSGRRFLRDGLFAEVRAGLGGGSVWVSPTDPNRASTSDYMSVVSPHNCASQ